MKRVLPNVGKQFHQLPMFMSAREIRSQYQALDGDRDLVYGADGEEHDENDDQLFERKYDEAHDTEDADSGHTLADSVRWDGVRNPISLQTGGFGVYGKPQVLGGHHRLAVMEEHRPDDLMPVAHFENTVQARKSLGNRY